MKNKLRESFWSKYSLDEMNETEWEAICDRCGKCCLIKLENDDTLEVSYTKIACRLFDHSDCKCGNYDIRKKLVSVCIILNNETIKNSFSWMPSTCAYRLLEEGKQLEPWHHLISQSFDTVHSAGISVKNATISEFDISEEDYEDYILKDFK